MWAGTAAVAAPMRPLDPSTNTRGADCSVVVVIDPMSNVSIYNAKTNIFEYP